MFTGLVQTQGQLLGRATRNGGFRLSISHRFGALELGESIAVNGACLTVASFSEGRFDADCSTETANRTNLGQLAIGKSVHLERALRVGDRLGGHFVTGHIDAQVKLANILPAGEGLELGFDLPTELRPFVAEKGSITLDGVSLTINRVEVGQFAVLIIPHSQKETHLGSLRRGDGVNVEVDVLARYIVHLAKLGVADPSGASSGTEPMPNRNRDESLREAMAKAGMF